MKKHARIISVLLCIAMAIGLFAGVISSVGAAELTATLSKLSSGSNQTGDLTYEDGAITFAWNGAHRTDGFRIYKGSTMTISAKEGYEITNITYADLTSYSLADYATVTGGTLGSGVITNITGTVTIEATGKQLRLTSITVTYTATGDDGVCTHPNVEWNIGTENHQGYCPDCDTDIDNEHSYGNYKITEDQHYKECTVCGYKNDEGYHSTVYTHTAFQHTASCATCNYTTVATAYHTYDNGVCECGAEAATPLSDGDQVFFYCNGYVITATDSDGKLAGAAATITDGELTAEGAAPVDVHLDATTRYYTFTIGGKYLTTDADGGTLVLVDEADDYSLWVMEAVTNGYLIKNLASLYNGSYPQYIEYYNGFTTYSLYATSNLTYYAFTFYGVPEGCLHPNADWVTTETTHTKVCPDCNTVLVEEAEHSFDTYSINDTHHWQECSVCGYASAKTEHTYGDDHSCVCGAVTMDENADKLIISEVYGGGGNSGAAYTHDFIEIYNPTDEVIYLAGLTLQRASATGTFQTGKDYLYAFPSTALIQPNSYYVVWAAKGGNNGTNLVNGDPDWTANLGSSNFKVALVKGSEAVTINEDGTYSDTVIDLVGAGSATCYEGTAAAKAPGNATSVQRMMTALGLMLDTNNNGGDFTVAAPSPGKYTSFSHSSVSLGESLDLFFFLPQSMVPAAVEGELIYATLNDGTPIYMENWYTHTIGDVEYYAIRYSGIAARQMHVPVTAKVYYGVPADGETQTGYLLCTMTESVQSYAERGYQIETYKSFMVTLLNYGHAAQVYFNSLDAANLITEVNASLTDDEKLVPALSAEAIEATGTTANFLGSNLDLESHIGLKFNFNIDEDNCYSASVAVTYTTHWDKQKTQDYYADGEYDEDGEYTHCSVDVTTLGLADYNSLVTVTITDEGGTILGQATDSMYNYLTRAANSTDSAELKSLCDALYQLMLASYSYLHG